MGRKKSVTFPKRRLIYSIFVLLCLGLASCTAVRTITNTAETKKNEDGTTLIQTKVVESYVGTKQSKI